MNQSFGGRRPGRRNSQLCREKIFVAALLEENNNNNNNNSKQTKVPSLLSFIFILSHQLTLYQNNNNNNNHERERERERERCRYCSNTPKKDKTSTTAIRFIDICQHQTFSIFRFWILHSFDKNNIRYKQHQQS